MKVFTEILVRYWLRCYWVLKWDVSDLAIILLRTWLSEIVVEVFDVFVLLIFVWMIMNRKQSRRHTLGNEVNCRNALKENCKCLSLLHSLTLSASNIGYSLIILHITVHKLFVIIVRSCGWCRDEWGHFLSFILMWHETFMLLTFTFNSFTRATLPRKCVKW